MIRIPPVVLAAVAVGVVVIGCGTPDSQPKSSHKQPPAEVRVAGAQFSPDGKLLFTHFYIGHGSRDNIRDFKPLRLWDVATGDEIRSFGEPALGGLVFMPDGNVIGSFGENQRLQVWEPTTGKVVRTFDRIPGAYARAISRDGKLLLTTPHGSGGFELWDVATGKYLHTRSEGSLGAITFTPDGKQVYARFTATSGVPWEKIAVGVWDVASGKLIRTEGWKESWKYPLAFSPDGKLAISDRWDGDYKETAYLVLWDLASGEVVRQFDKRAPRGLPNHAAAEGVTFRMAGKQVVSVDGDGMRLWDVATGKEVWSVNVNGASVCAFSADGNLAFTGSDAWALQGRMSLKVWDTGSGKLLRNLEIPRQPDPNAP